MDAKYSCGFCGKTNTKFKDVYSGGLFSRKIGETEAVDKHADKYYRCAGCGLIMCATCCERHGAVKKKIGVFSTKHLSSCPKCSSKMLKIN